MVLPDFLLCCLPNDPTLQVAKCPAKDVSDHQNLADIQEVCLGRHALSQGTLSA